MPLRNAGGGPGVRSGADARTLSVAQMSTFRMPYEDEDGNHCSENHILRI